VRTTSNIVVEVPERSRNTYEHDPGLGAIELDRFPCSSIVCPVDYGTVPDTWDADEPLDVTVLVSEPTVPGLIAAGCARREALDTLGERA